MCDSDKVCRGLSNFGRIQRMNIDELADFLDSVSEYEGCPWADWFEETFCQNCDPVEEDGGIYSRCEYNDEKYPCKCGDLKDAPTRDIIRAWLNPTYKS